MKYPFSYTMDVAERLTPETEIKITLENIMMPIIAAVVFQVLFIILNLIDGKDDLIVGLAGGGGFIPSAVTAFTIMAILLAFWIGIAAVNAGGNIGDALVGSAIVGLVYGVLTSLFQEVFFDKALDINGNVTEDFFIDGYFGKGMFLNILYLTTLFIMIGFIASGIAEDMFGEVDDKQAKSPTKKAPAKKAPAKKAPAKKKTTKKATKADE